MSDKAGSNATTIGTTGVTRRHSLQDEYLKRLCNTGREVYVYLVNRLRVRGKVEAFDNYAILLFRRATKKETAVLTEEAEVRDGRQILVFKSGIVTITPVRLAGSIVRTPRVKRLDARLVDDDSDVS